jgi:hypothetical protein
LESQLLKGSIYNMHGLKDKMTAGGGGGAETVADGASRNGEGSKSNLPEEPATQPNKKGAGFKRANFKRPIKAVAMTAAVKSDEIHNVEFPDDSAIISDLSLLSLSSTMNDHEWSSNTEAPETAPSWPARLRYEPPTQTLHYHDDLSLSLDSRIDQLLESFLTTDKHNLTQGTSTQSHVAGDANVLHLLDATTQQVLTRIAQLQAQQRRTKNNDDADNKTEDERHDDDDPARKLRELLSQQQHLLPGKQDAFLQRLPDSTLTVLLASSTAALTQLRQQYLQWMAKYPPDRATPVSVTEEFVTYVLQHLSSSDQTSSSNGAS